jgi:carboxyl-terminal processing protease
MRKYFHLLIIITLLFVFVPATHHNPGLFADETDYYLKIQKGLTYFQKVYKQVQLHYVEEIDPYQFVQAGIEGMLKELDPYTVFIEQEGDMRLRIITTGKYGGLGMEIGLHNDEVTVITPMDDSPAKKAGIRAGDVVLKIDGVEIADMESDKISEMLRGPVDSAVNLTIRRPGEVEPLTLTVQRQEIVIKDVDYSEFVAPGIAYLRLTGFTDKAAYEVLDAITELRGQQEITGFILDLRGNSGGLLETAVDIAGIFLPKGTPVVSTRGFRDGEYNFATHSNPILGDVPLAVLVDGGSASAAEIVAGALQDLDRAIIVGSETFGKGLVQKVYSVDKNDNTKIKVTTAKYYIPSGRCIQKKDYTKNKPVFYANGNDSLQIEHDAFKTVNNRTVYEKGGITPDRPIDGREEHRVLDELYRQSHLFNFAVDYCRKNSDAPKSIQVDEKLYNQFTDYLNSVGFTYEIEGEEGLREFIEKARAKNYPDHMITESESMLAELEQLKKSDLSANAEVIKRALLEELAEKYYGTHGRLEYALGQDDVLSNAVEVIKNQREYKKILAIK